ncbi:TIGR00645 family protein [Elioraea sp.]|uniref:TIGR00645 family protein n=1 Tax=Elioraea sp. TaxID=2185103 RepID=UPI0025C65248|nr:TIGR00645 family protein [Elioraea sp.]
MNGLQKIIERTILASRYVLVVFYVGLAVALLVFAGQFVLKITDVIMKFPARDETEVLLAMLQLIDKALVAGLVVMVMLSSYDNFVSRLDNGDEDAPRITWISQLDPGSLKIKVASAIVAISSIHLLQIFMNSANFTNDDIYWKVVIHIVFIASALFLGVLDRLTVIWPSTGEKGGK